MALKRLHKYFIKVILWWCWDALGIYGAGGLGLFSPNYVVFLVRVFLNEINI